MLDNPSLLLARSFNASEINALTDHQHILMVNQSSDGYCLQLANDFADKQFTAFSYNVAAHQSLKDAPANLKSLCAAQLTADDIGPQKFDCVVIYFPKSKPEFELLLQNLFNHVAIDAPIYLVGDNKGGVKTCDKLMQTFCRKANKVDAAKHCALYQTMLTQASAPFVLADWYKNYPVNINDVELNVYTLPGVFSFGAIDMGTRLLLESVKAKTSDKSQKVLDFGCGAGLIGAFLAKLNKNVTVTGIDVSALAIESTLKTYQQNNIDGTAILSDGLSGLSGLAGLGGLGGNFDQVYSNPPFHSGVKTNYAITELFLNTIKGYIYPGGSLTIVANSFLNYQPLLTAQFGCYNTLVSNRRFHVYQASNSTKG
ncbi:MAG: 16S rRNA (guanine1207-N2)-methyltransferase [Phenylobacterium sp.]|jgi:16S rRNA (guanine1207-N2)-methyltransferase